MKHLRALIIEDSEDDCEILLRHLRQNNFQVEYLRVETAEAMEDALEQQEWQIILSDFSMPRFDGLGALATLHQTELDIPFIIISGTIGEDTAVQSMLAGVDDYFIKGKLGRLGPAIERELAEAENRAERHRVEAELEENKKRLQLALLGSGMGVWEWNLQTDAIFWSPECYKIYGVEASAETLTDFTKLVHPEDLAKLVSAGQIAIDSHQKYSAEFRIINPHGEIQWLANNGLAEYGTNGLPVRLIGTVQDITERKQAENSLRESEENFRAIIQATTQFVWRADKYGAGTELFQWFSELSGRNISDVFGIIDLIHPDDIEIAQRSRKKAFQDKTVFNMVIRVFTKNNEYCYLATRSVPVFNQDGSFREWIGTFNDITDRMHTEEALRKNEAQLKLVSDTVPTLIMQLDARLHVLFTNKPCLQFFGLPEAEILGTHISKVFNETAYKLILPEFERVLTGEPFIVERLSFQEDSSRFLRFNYVPDFDEKGNVQGFFAFVIDLTENKRSEEKLRKSEERFRSLVNATAQIVWTADSNGILQSAHTPHGAPLGGTSDNMMDE
ncbi:MAG: PAS domain S-box protein, partial [Actinomycetota bacterium]